MFSQGLETLGVDHARGQVLVGHSLLEDLEVKRRCIRLDYAGDFHLDVVPTLSGRGEVLLIGEGRSWGETNPKGLDTWHTKTNRRLDGSFNALLRMMKRWNFYELSVPSVTLAVMLGNYLPDLPRSGGNTREACLVAVCSSSGWRGEGSMDSSSGSLSVSSH